VLCLQIIACIKREAAFETIALSDLYIPNQLRFGNCVSDGIAGAAQDIFTVHFLIFVQKICLAMVIKYVFMLFVNYLFSSNYPSFFYKAKNNVRKGGAKG
jgi:hypothetical protein